MLSSYLIVANRSRFGLPPLVEVPVPDARIDRIERLVIMIHRTN